ncbi:MAG: hypothetical protein Q4B22_05115 [Eubacteriales bacterium]|nr:hypothetical protein [Eubacteriales bacterium]
MRRVAEIMYVVPEERQAFLKKITNPSAEVQKFMWTHGIRNQYFFQVEDKILMTFEYVGSDFYADMNAFSSIQAAEGYLIEKRPRDIKASEIRSVNWWAPLKILGKNLEKDPFAGGATISDENIAQMSKYGAMLADIDDDLGYDDSDWDGPTIW